MNFILYKKIAQDGVAYVQNEYGKILIQSNNYIEAYDYFEKGAKNNYVNAQLNLALMHYNKKYDILDYNKAYYWVNKAAKEEYDKAQYYMGIFLEKGIGCRKDLDQAILWFEKSAKNAYLKAYEKLKHYSHTLGVDIK